jgi:proteic killer suppression protein
VIQTFADVGSSDIYAGVDSRTARQTLPKPLWRVARRTLHWIDSARAIEVLRVPPGNRLESLKGTRAATWSIRINDQYRITFRFEQGHAYEVCCEDYQQGAHTRRAAGTADASG